MRLVLTAAVLAALTAACATPQKPTRTVVVHRAPEVVVVNEAPAPAPTPPEAVGTAVGGPATTGTYDPDQRNPVPGSVREYINRFPPAGTMSK